MSSASADSLIALLEAELDSDASVYLALAETLRREGRLPEAEQRARAGLDHNPETVEGWLVLVAILLDQGRVDEARELVVARIGELIPAVEALAPAPPIEGPVDGFTGSELDRAFELAETDRDQLIDADRVAEEALRGADSAALDQIAPSDGSPFATETVAELLEQQGDVEGARQLRTALGPSPEAAPEKALSASAHPIATLEKWLGNKHSSPCPWPPTAP